MTSGVSAHEETLALNGIDLHVTIAGTGPPLLMLHGLTANASFMRREILDLAGDFRVIAPDLRGHGASTRPARFTLADHVADMVSLLAALAVDRAAVMGTSMGSYVAQALAIAEPERVATMTLIVAKASGITSSSSAYLAEHAAEVADLSPQEQQAWLGERMCAPGTPLAVRRALADWVTAQRGAGLAMTEVQMAAANEALAGFDFRADLPRVQVPTLVISGRHDILNPPWAGAEIAGLMPDSRFLVFERSGHLLPWEEPERLAAVLREFLLDCPIAAEV